MNAPEHFEERLLEQLRQVVAERPAPLPGNPDRRPRRMRLAIAGGGCAAALAAALIVAGSGDGTAAAFAVQPHSDGAVTISIHSLSDAAGLQQSLRAAGIPAVVTYVPADQASCTGPPPGAAGGSEGGASGSLQWTESGGEGPSLSGPGARTEGGGSPPPPGAMSTKVGVGPDGATFTIDPGTIDPGQKVYITTSTGALTSIGVQVSKEGAGAGVPCLPSPPETGAGGR